MASASISSPIYFSGTTPPHRHHHLSLHPSSLFFSFPLPSLPRFFALRAVTTGAQGGGVDSHGVQDPAVLRRPVVSSTVPSCDEEDGVEGGVPGDNVDGKDGAAEDGKPRGRGRRGGREQRREEWVDWEDQILEDTVPLVGFVRMILHSGKYESGDRLSPEHEKTILERLLAHHPQYEKKVGCGIDFITIGFHPDYESSRCLFIVRKDGELVDFSYWKCIKGLIRKKYPLYADSFILRHFRRRRNSD